MKQEICICVTFKCNWDCEYCMVNTHNTKEITFDTIKFNLDKCEHGSTVSLSGGEPGAAPREVIEECFRVLTEKECRIQVNTNGLFFTNYPQYLHLCSSFFYHCSENLDKPINIPPVPSSKVNYVLVITDKNISRLESFINMYKHITFSIVLAYPNMNGSHLSFKNRAYIHNLGLKIMNPLGIKTDTSKKLMKLGYDVQKITRIKE